MNRTTAMPATTPAATILARLTVGQLDELYERLWQRYLQHTLALLEGRRSLNVSAGALVLRVVRRDMADFRRRRFDTGRYAEDVMADRVRRVDATTLWLECSATNYNLDEGGTFDGGGIRRLCGIGHRYRLSLDRYGRAPHVPVRSVYQLMRLVERTLRQRQGAPTHADELPFELVELTDDGWMQEAVGMAVELFGVSTAVE